MQENNNEISLLELWIKIWKNKFIIAIIIIVVTLIGLIAIFFINRTSVTVTSNFNYRFINEGQTEFADGSFFNYRELLEKDELTKVKNKDKKYSNVDIEAIEKDKDAKITMVEETNKDNVVIKRYYQIVLPTKYFGRDTELTSDFIKSIHANLLMKVEEKNAILKIHNYFQPSSISVINRNTHTDNLTYPELIRLFRNQHSLMVSQHESFQARYGVSAQIEGVKFDELFRSYSFWYEHVVMLNRLETEIEEKHYIRNIPISLNFANLEIIRLEKEFAINENIIEELKQLYTDLVQNSSVSIIGDNTLLNDISAKTTQNILIQRELDKYKNVVLSIENNTVINDPDFEANFDKLIKDYTQIVNDYNDYYIKFLNEEARYLPYGDNEFIIESKFNLALMGVVLVLVSGIGGVVFALIKESLPEKKEQLEN